MNSISEIEKRKKVEQLFKNAYGKKKKKSKKFTKVVYSKFENFIEKKKKHIEEEKQKKEEKLLKELIPLKKLTKSKQTKIDFLQRNKLFLEKKNEKIEKKQKEKIEEKEKNRVSYSFKPKINDPNIQRGLDDLLNWKKRKNEKIEFEKQRQIQNLQTNKNFKAKKIHIKNEIPIKEVHNRLLHYKKIYKKNIKKKEKEIYKNFKSKSKPKKKRQILQNYQSEYKMDINRYKKKSNQKNFISNNNKSLVDIKVLNQNSKRSMSFIHTMNNLNKTITKKLLKIKNESQKRDNLFEAEKIEKWEHLLKGIKRVKKGLNEELEVKSVFGADFARGDFSREIKKSISFGVLDGPVLEGLEIYGEGREVGGDKRDFGFVKDLEEGRDLENEGYLGNGGEIGELQHPGDGNMGVGEDFGIENGINEDFGEKREIDFVKKEKLEKKVKKYQEDNGILNFDRFEEKNNIIDMNRESNLSEISNSKSKNTDHQNTLNYGSTKKNKKISDNGIMDFQRFSEKNQISKKDQKITNTRKKKSAKSRKSIKSIKSKSRRSISKKSIDSKKNQKKSNSKVKNSSYMNIYNKANSILSKKLDNSINSKKSDKRQVFNLNDILERNSEKTFFGVNNFNVAKNQKDDNWSEFQIDNDQNFLDQNIEKKYQSKNSNLSKKKKKSKKTNKKFFLNKPSSSKKKKPFDFEKERKKFLQNNPEIKRNILNKKKNIFKKNEIFNIPENEESIENIQNSEFNNNQGSLLLQEFIGEGNDLDLHTVSKRNIIDDITGQQDELMNNVSKYFG